MDKIFALFDQYLKLDSIQSPYLLLAYKIALVLITTTVIWLVFRSILAIVEGRVKKYLFFNNSRQIFKIFRKALFLGLVLLGGTYLFRQFNAPLLEKILHAVLIILLAGPAKNFLVVTIGYMQDRIASRTDNKVDDIIFELLIKFADFLIYATAIIISLDRLGVNVMPFIAGAGVAGIAIGFAAKDTLSNMIAGVLLIIDRPFEIGDRIEVWSAPAGSATWGDVIDIGLRATKIRTTDHIIIVIPNNEIMRRDIINYTLMSESIRVRVNIGVAYDTDIPKAKKIILEVADSAEWISKDPPPKVVVRNFGESSVDLQLRVWIAEARRRMETISFITDKVKEAFDNEGVEIPYPKRDIYIHQET